MEERSFSTKTDLEIALELEQGIIAASGFTARCGCHRDVLCTIPNTNLYCVTFCKHDYGPSFFSFDQWYWWYDLEQQILVPRERFDDIFNRMKMANGTIIGCLGSQRFEIDIGGRADEVYPCSARARGAPNGRRLRP